MIKYWDKVLEVGALIGGAVSGIYGGWDTMLTVLVAVMAMDYLTGIIVGMLGKSAKTDGGGLDSKVGFVGLIKKAFILLVVLMAALLDRIMPDGQAVFRSMMVWFYIANESLSVLENLSLIGVPFPAFIKNALEQIKKKNDDPEDKKQPEKAEETKAETD